ncbi:hypothetical protein [Undibacterium oligocarboniphilum]|uniref:Uncharacterized protein n=1 Tax=Undibacterium oligocarboniphilum TaxID=666702 RepID=A0A850QQ40_9BURK|nr:hypothetical protein [Undibacterium oligocarboniphilum]MBC3871840.1 hypothetical protein [Undibacterium oligocarboniphilum]NVO79453.1 hypothetical protein [Undibacterium oligocarboniphilum]
MSTTPFSPELIAACQSAIKQQISENSQFLQHVLGITGYGQLPKLIEQVSIDLRLPERAKRVRELFTRLETLVKSSPKDAYVIVEKVDGVGGHEFTKYETIISGGAGRIAIGGKYDCYTSPPDPSFIQRRIFEFDVFACRAYCESIIHLNDCREVIRTKHLHVGMQIPRLKLDGIPNAVTVTISQVNFAEGSIKLSLNRRGSFIKFIHMPASKLAVLADLDGIISPKSTTHVSNKVLYS